MAEFKYTPWEYSDVKEEEEQRNETEWGTPQAGLRYLRIEHATYNPDDGCYRIIFTDISDNIKFTVYNNTMTAPKCDDNGVIIKPAEPRISVRNALVSLGKALAGAPIGIPPTNAIIGGVVTADVKLSENKKNPERPFIDIYHYDPVPRSIAEGFSNLETPEGEIAQYFTED